MEGEAQPSLEDVISRLQEIGMNGILGNGEVMATLRQVFRAARQGHPRAIAFSHRFFMNVLNGFTSMATPSDQFEIDLRRDLNPSNWYFIYEGLYPWEFPPVAQNAFYGSAVQTAIVTYNILRHAEMNEYWGRFQTALNHLANRMDLDTPDNMVFARTLATTAELFDVADMSPDIAMLFFHVFLRSPGLQETPERAGNIEVFIRNILEDAGRRGQNPGLYEAYIQSDEGRELERLYPQTNAEYSAVRGVHRRNRNTRKSRWYDWPPSTG